MLFKCLKSLLRYAMFKEDLRYFSAKKIDARNLKTSATIGRLENLLQLNRKYQVNSYKMFF